MPKYFSMHVEFKQRAIVNGVKTKIYSIWEQANHCRIFAGYYTGKSAKDAYNNYEQISLFDEETNDDFDDEY